MLKRYTADHRIVNHDHISATVPVVEQLMFLRRSGRVHRYHTEELIKPQDVAQHSYGVAWLCWQLYQGACPSTVLIWALAHDAAEHATGDIPSPTKRALGIKGKVDSIEEDLLAHNGIDLPQLYPAEAFVLKLADNLDGVLHVLHERELGNRTLTQAWVNYVSYVQEVIQEGLHDEAAAQAQAILNYAMERWNDIESK